MQEVVVNYYSNEKLPFFLSKAYCSTLFTYKLHYINTIQNIFAKFCCIEATILTPIKYEVIHLLLIFIYLIWKNIELNRNIKLSNSFHVIHQHG